MDKFARIVARYGGDCRVPSLSCTAQFCAMVFAQLTYRESLRDIETCLLANQTKLWSMGFRAPVKRSTLADANEGRDWHTLYTLLQILSVSVYEKTQLSQAFVGSGQLQNQADFANQLN